MRKMGKRMKSFLERIREKEKMKRTLKNKNGIKINEKRFSKRFQGGEGDEFRRQRYEKSSSSESSLNLLEKEPSQNDKI